MSALSNFLFAQILMAQSYAFHAHAPSALIKPSKGLSFIDNPALQSLDTLKSLRLAINPAPFGIKEYSSYYVSYDVDKVEQLKHTIALDGILGSLFSDLQGVYSISWRDPEGIFLAGMSVKSEFASFDKALKYKSSAFSIGTLYSLTSQCNLGSYFSGMIHRSEHFANGIDYTGMKSAVGLCYLIADEFEYNLDFVIYTSGTGFLLSATIPIDNSFTTKVSYATALQSIDVECKLAAKQWTFHANILYHQFLGIQYAFGMAYYPSLTEY